MTHYNRIYKIIYFGFPCIILLSCTLVNIPNTITFTPEITQTAIPISTNTTTITPTLIPTPTHTPTESPLSVDPLAKIWDVECMTKGCLMFLDIAYGNPNNLDYLTITVAINREKKDIAFISFIIPNKVDKEKGLTISFADSQQNSSGEWQIILAEDTLRVLQLEGCKSDYCTARVIGGVIPATSGEIELNLLTQFLSHRIVLFMYWYKGESITVSTTLSGFQSQYPDVIQEYLK